jgi:glycosyltransferase involved in cell wall biosynthesis
VEFANRLTARGHSVAIVSPRVSDSTLQTIDPGVRLIWAASRIRPAVGHTLANAFVAFDLFAQVPSSDVVVATYTPTAIPAFFAAAVRRARALWLYGDYFEMFERRPIERWTIKLLAKRFTSVIAYSQASVDELAIYCGARAAVVGLGLPGERWLGPPSLPTRTTMALYLGDVRRRKGLMDFIQAAEIASKSVPQLRVVIARKDEGDVNCSVPHDVVVRPSDKCLAELYRSCGCFVSTSWFEGLGLPPLQAMACGAPVVVTDQRGARDYAVSEQNCLVVPIKSPAAVADAMVRILQNPPLARRLGAAGIETARRYNWDDALDRFELALGIEPRRAMVDNGAI